MAKRIYFETIKKWALRLGIPSVSIIFLLFLYLQSLDLIVITGYSWNEMCPGTLDEPCWVIINFTPREDIFIYRVGYDPWGRNTPFNFSEGLSDWKLQRSWNYYPYDEIGGPNDWRDIPLEKGCTGSWCGCYWCRKNVTAEYSIVFRKDRNYQVRVLAYKEDAFTDVKWGFGDLDPIWKGIGEYRKIKIAGREYTPTGLSEFHLPINITLYKNMTVPKSKIKKIVKNKVGRRFKIESWGIDYLTTYSVLKPNCTKKYTPWNETIFTNGSWHTLVYANYTDVCYPYRGEEYRWKSLPDIIEIKANESIIIDLWAHKKASLGHSGIDIRLKIGKYELTKMSWWNSSYNKKTTISAIVKDSISKDQYSDYPINLSFDTSGLDENSSIIRVVNSSGSEIPYLLISPNYANSSIWINFTNVTLSTDYVIYYDNITPMGSVSVPNVTRFNKMSGTTFDKDIHNTDVSDLPDWSDTGTCCVVNNSWGYGGSTDGNNSLFHKATSDKDSIYTFPTTANIVKFEWWQRSAFYLLYFEDTGVGNPIAFRTASHSLSYQDSTGGWTDTGEVINETDVTHWEVIFDTNANGGQGKWNLTIRLADGTHVYSITNVDCYNYPPGQIDDLKFYTSGGGAGYGHSYHIDNLIIRNDVVDKDPITRAGIEETYPTTPPNEVTLESPADDGVSTSLTVNFTYTPIFYNGVIFNCSLYNNETSWTLKQTNTTQVINDTVNGISYTFSNYEIYKWNIYCNNTSSEVFASANYTVNVSLPDNVPSVTLVNPDDNATKQTPVTFQYTPIDDLGFMVAELYLNNTTSKDGYWIDKTVLPNIRTDPAGAVVNNIFYVMGGKSAMESGHSDKIWGYNVSNDTWTAMADIPIKVEQSAACAVDDSIYLFGGIDAAYQHRLNDSYKYNTTTNTWYSIANFTYNISGSISTNYNGNCYIASSVTCDENNNNCVATPILIRYNVATDDYTTLTNSSTPHVWGSMSEYNGNLYAFSGGSPRNNWTEVYSVSGNSWSVVYHNMTLERYGLGRTRSNYTDLIFMVGGQEGDPADYLQSLTVYNITNDSFPPASTYPDADYEVEGHAHGVVANGSDWYYIFSGGRNGEVAQDYTEIFFINPSHEGFGVVANNSSAITNDSTNSIVYSFPTIGDYRWSVRLTDSGGQSVFAVPNRSLTVTAAAPGAIGTNITLYLNGTEGNVNYTYEEIANLTGVINVTDLHVEIYINYTLVHNDTTVSTNITTNNTFKNATYPIMANYTGNTTYEASNQTWWLYMNKATTNIDMWLNGTKNSDKTLTYPSDVNATCVININQTNQDSFHLLRNGTSQGTQSGQVIGYNDDLTVRAYNFTCNYTQTENYTGIMKEYTLTLNKGTPTLHLYLNGTEGSKNYSYGEIMNLTGWVEHGDTLPTNTTVYFENASVWSGWDSHNWDRDTGHGPYKAVDDDWDTYAAGNHSGSDFVEIYENYTVLAEHDEVITCINWSTKGYDVDGGNWQDHIRRAPPGGWEQYFTGPTNLEHISNVSTENDTLLATHYPPGDFLDRTGSEIQIRHKLYLSIVNPDKPRYYEGNLSYTYNRIFRIITNVTNKTSNRMVSNISESNSDYGGLGTYNITLYYYESENYTDNSLTYWFNITKASSNVTLYLNGTNANFSTFYGNYVNITATCNATDEYFWLILNDTLIHNGTNSLENTTLLSVGFWNVTGYYPGNNYYSDEQTLWIEVNASTMVLYLNGTASDRYYEYDYPINITGNSTYGTVCLTIEELRDNFSCGSTPQNYYWVAESMEHKFSDSTNFKNLTINTTVYIQSNNESITFIDTKWNFTGYLTIQEDDTEDDWVDDDYTLNPGNAVDEDWDTYATNNSIYEWIINVTYYIQDQNINSQTTNYSVKYFAADEFHLSCFNSSNQWDMLVDYGVVAGVGGGLNTSNGTYPQACLSKSPLQLRLYGLQNSTHETWIYEEEIIWANYPEDIEIDIGSDKIVDKSFVGYLNETTFNLEGLNDSSTAKNFTFDIGGGYDIAYITLPRQINLTSAYLNISGFTGEMWTSYDDTEDDWTSNGTWSSQESAWRCVDEDWDTFGATSITFTGLACLFENYTLPGVEVGSINTYVKSTGSVLVGESHYLYWYNWTKGNWTLMESWASTGTYYINVTNDSTNFISSGEPFMMMTCVDDTSAVAGLYVMYEGKIRWAVSASNATNLYINVGNDDDIEWNYTGEFNLSTSPNRTSDLSSEFNDYSWSSDCTETTCDVPIVLHTETAATLEISDIDIRYNPNPITLNTTKFQELLNDSTTINITLNASKWGTLKIDDLNFSYYGSQNYTVFAHDIDYNSNSTKYNVSVVYSNYSKELPYTFTDVMIFMPPTNSSLNVTPYGQTSVTPLHNITGENYDRPFNLSIKFNDTLHSCINVTISNTTSKDDGFLINTTFQTILCNVTFKESKGLRYWLDLDNCTSGVWRNVTIELESCCYMCSCW